MIWKNGGYRQKRGVCTIIPGLTDILKFTHCLNANITSRIFNVQKRIFSL